MKISPIQNYNNCNVNRHNVNFYAKGIYPGSFDPITKGHMDIIKRAGKMFDSLTILVAKNPEKNEFLTVEQRINLIKKALDFEGFKNIYVDSFNGLTVDYAKKAGAEYMVRGIRDSKDLDYEMELYGVNRLINSSVDTIFIPTKPEFEKISSSLVRKLYKMGADIANFVPECVSKFLSQSHERQCVESSLTNSMKLLGADTKLIDKTYNEIIAAYSNNRKYHNLNHIENMLKLFDEFLINSKEASKVTNPAELRLAIILHDFVNGEPLEIEKSIEYAKKVLKSINSEYDTENIVRLIKATDHGEFKRFETFDEKLIHDLDLAILGTQPDEYRKYVKTVREEYSQYSDFDFGRARVKVLDYFLYNPVIYRTDYFIRKFENGARVNLLNEKALYIHNKIC